jgi:hypothetical protein
MLTKLFPFLNKKRTPRESLSDPDLGSMMWSSDEEGWTGKFNGFRFILDYEDQEVPTESLISFAKEFLISSETFVQAIAKAKSGALTLRPPKIANEIEELQINALSFFMLKGEPYVFISFDGGCDGRCWRLEFSNGEWSNLGFDD